MSVLHSWSIFLALSIECLLSFTFNTTPKVEWETQHLYSNTHFFECLRIWVLSTTSKNSNGMLRVTLNRYSKFKTQHSKKKLSMGSWCQSLDFFSEKNFNQIYLIFFACLFPPSCSETSPNVAENPQTGNSNERSSMIIYIQVHLHSFTININIVFEHLLILI